MDEQDRIEVKKIVDEMLLKKKLSELQIGFNKGRGHSHNGKDSGLLKGLIGTHAFATATQTDYEHDVEEKVVLGSTVVDTNEWFDNDNNRIRVNISGWYIVFGSLLWMNNAGMETGERYTMNVWANGTSGTRLCNDLGYGTASQYLSLKKFTIVHLDAGDYTELFATNHGTTDTADTYGDATNNNWTCLEVYLFKAD